MTLPPDIATLRGGAFLEALTRFAEDWAAHFVAQSQAHHAMHGAPNPGALQYADAFSAFANMSRQLRFSGEEHIERMARLRSEGKRVFSETDLTVDAAIAAARSAFIRPAAALRTGAPPAASSEAA